MPSTERTSAVAPTRREALRRGGNSLLPVLTTAAFALCAALFTVAAQARNEAAPPTGLVVADSVALRAAPRDAAPQWVSLWRGEALQLRGSRGDWLQVWDPHRERGGYVRAAQVMALPGAGTGSASRAVADLAAQLRLVRQQPGAEALGIGLAAAIIERAEPGWLASADGADMLDNLVSLQERLAARMHTASERPQVALAHAEVAARYGFPLQWVSVADGSQQPCPHPQPASLLLAHPAASAAQQARAALSLTRTDCLDASLLPSEHLKALQQHAEQLGRIEATALVPVERNRLLLRRASVWARIAFARRADDGRAAATQAFAAWQQIIPAELAEDDAPALREAAIRLSPQRWALQAPLRDAHVGGFALQLEAREPGQTCLVWGDKTEAEIGRRCSHGQIHLASARAAPDGRSVVVSVQVLDGWTELWRLDRQGEVRVLPPALQTPGLGAVEWAGWARGPSGLQVLVAREAEAGGRILRRFEVYGDDWDAPVRWAGDFSVLGAFQRSADAGWRGSSPLAR